VHPDERKFVVRAGKLACSPRGQDAHTTDIFFKHWDVPVAVSSFVKYTMFL